MDCSESMNLHHLCHLNLFSESARPSIEVGTFSSPCKKPSGLQHCKQFLFMFSQKRCSPASIPIINKIFVIGFFWSSPEVLKELAKGRRKIFGDVVIKHLNTSQLHGSSRWWYEIDTYPVGSCSCVMTTSPFFSSSSISKSFCWLKF